MVRCGGAQVHALWPVSLPKRVYLCGGSVLRHLSAYLHVLPLALNKL